MNEQIEIKVGQIWVTKQTEKVIKSSFKGFIGILEAEGL